MNKLPFTVLLIGLMHASYAQSTDKPEKQNAFYPLNLPYALFSRYHTSVELGVNRVDHLLIGGHYNKQLNGRDGRGWGAEIQYRINVNRDANVQFKSVSYWGIYLDHDRLKPEPFYFQPYQTGDTYIRMTNLGILFGSNFNLSKGLLADIYLGGGLVVDRVKDYDYSYKDIYPYGKVGLQLGIRF